MPNGEYTPSTVKELIRMHQQVRELYASHSALSNNDIDALIGIRERATNRSDEQIDWKSVDLIDAQLAQVPPGTRNDVDLLLGRRAELPERVEYQLRPNSTQAEIDRQQRIYEQLSAVKEVWSTSEQRAEWKDTGAAQIEQAAQEKQDDYLRYIADQHEDRLDFLRLCGDLAI